LKWGVERYCTGLALGALGKPFEPHIAADVPAGEHAGDVQAGNVQAENVQAENVQAGNVQAGNVQLGHLRMRADL
jgi:hypothetical protein